MTAYSPISLVDASRTACSAVPGMFSRALVTGCFADWQEFKRAVSSSLSDEQQATLAFFALRAMKAELAEQVAATSIDPGAGQPIPPLLGYMDEAAFWADMAAPAELEAYCLAAFRAMPRERQAAFLAHAQRGRAA